MSIPLDRLYEFIETQAQNVCNDDVVIYRFTPHGSKKVSDLKQMRTYTWPQMLSLCPIICHDQEPLDFDSNDNNSDEIFADPNSGYYRLLKDNALVPNRFNLRFSGNIFDKCMLLHSEQRSLDVDKYRACDYVPVYYWSHAVIAGDWFRYAQHHLLQKNVTKQFLIYNRAWEGTREYRIKFAELLLTHGLVDHCKTWFNPVNEENSQHYHNHVFKNPIWKPQHDLDEIFPSSGATACYSADIDFVDYQSTDIEIVLETLFDDVRWHLTEKTLRPLACGQPFVLAATPGSLEYLRSYGFETFSQVWDESYDQETDPGQRMNKILQLMKTMSRWTPEQKQSNMQEARLIAQRNKQRFFSSEFFNQVVSELNSNLDKAWHEIEHTNTASKFFANRRRLAKVPEIRQILSNAVPHPDKELYQQKYSTYDRQNILRVVQQARQYYLRSSQDK